ncbi:response regulator [Novosphingobium sp.]|uniref:response regulator n=1 Tax=Novosphingobium sp. TaxID=1874826 RepID=UPI0031CF1FF6
MTSILVVDDDAQIRALLCDYLAEAGMSAQGVGDGDAMWRHLDEHQPDLIILDLMLPGTDGLSLCRSLVERLDIPVIMLTARGALIDRIVGLEMGADDYLAKPFDPRELLARIKVILRRVGRSTQRSEEPALLHFAGWTLDTKRNLLLSDDSAEPLLIAGVDFLTLRTLLGEPYQTLSRDYLSQRIYGRERDPADRAIDMSISRLRQMLGDDARNPMLIRTVRNGGYVLSADVAAQA